MSVGTLYVVSAPSGAGKTSLVGKLVEQLPDIKTSISHTTRPLRKGEVHGQHYHFVDEKQFMDMMNEAEFLESAQVFDNYYGTSQSAVEKMLQSGTDVILEIDWQGAEQVRKVLPDCISIFILPPSRQALHDRLNKRGQDAEAVINKRMAQAKEEMSHYNEYDYLIINDDFETALHQFKSIITAGRQEISRQTYDHQDLLQELLN